MRDLPDFVAASCAGSTNTYLVRWGPCPWEVDKTDLRIVLAIKGEFNIRCNGWKSAYLLIRLELRLVDGYGGGGGCRGGHGRRCGVCGRVGHRVLPRRARSVIVNLTVPVIPLVMLHIVVPVRADVRSVIGRRRGRFGDGAGLVTDVGGRRMTAARSVNVTAIRLMRRRRIVTLRRARERRHTRIDGRDDRDGPVRLSIRRPVPHHVPENTNFKSLKSQNYANLRPSSHHGPFRHHLRRIH